MVMNILYFDYYTYKSYIIGHWKLSYYNIENSEKYLQLNNKYLELNDKYLELDDKETIYQELDIDYGGIEKTKKVIKMLNNNDNNIDYMNNIKFILQDDKKVYCMMQDDKKLYIHKDLLIDELKILIYNSEDYKYDYHNP
jgi:hypothetical protein